MNDVVFGGLPAAVASDRADKQVDPVATALMPMAPDSTQREASGANDAC